MAAVALEWRAPAMAHGWSGEKRTMARKVPVLRCCSRRVQESEAGGVRRRSAAIGIVASCGLVVAAARAAVLEAEDDLELLERVKEDRKKRLQRQGVISSSANETGYVQDVVYKLSRVGEAIDKEDLSAAGAVLGSNPDAEWVKNVKAAFAKLSSSAEETLEADTFSSSLASLFSSVGKLDANSSKQHFVASATALEKWIGLAGLSTQLKGL